MNPFILSTLLIFRVTFPIALGLPTFEFSASILLRLLPNEIQPKQITPHTTGLKTDQVQTGFAPTEDEREHTLTMNLSIAFIA
jgi:hypothetical protein